MVGAMHLIRQIRALLTGSRRLAAEQGGAAAIEFALLLPLMLTLYISGVEISQAVSADRKVTLIAHTVSDLVAQASVPLAASDMTNILAAGRVVLTPYSPSNMSVIVSQLSIDANGNAWVDWSQASPSNIAHTPGTQITNLPSALAIPNTYLIWGESTYAYTPQLGYAITGTLNLYDQIFLSPRMGACVIFTGQTNRLCPGET
jgi:Flp pilus assembly protein TadG